MLPCICRDSTPTKRVRASPSSVPSCPEADGRNQTPPCCRDEFSAHSECLPQSLLGLLGARHLSSHLQADQSLAAPQLLCSTQLHVENLYTGTSREQSTHSKGGRRWEGASHFQYEKRMGQGMSNPTSTHQKSRRLAGLQAVFLGKYPSKNPSHLSQKIWLSTKLLDSSKLAEQASE